MDKNCENSELNIDENEDELEENIDANEEVLLEEIDTEVKDDSSELEQEYKKQGQKDCNDYVKEHEGYEKWNKLILNMALKFEEVSEDINKIVGEFNDSLNSKIEEINLEKKSNIENRAKGINIISKMFNNTVNRNLDKIRNYETLAKDELNKLEDIDINLEDDIIAKLNENYNYISQIRLKKDSIIKDYFDFINSYILPINDGILSGIQYIDSVKDEDINELVLPTYIKLEETAHELLKQIGIEEIKVEKLESIDYEKHEIFDIEETDDKELNEKVYEIIRTGYTYLEDIYSTGYNYVVRPVQIIVYKYIENDKVVD